MYYTYVFCPLGTTTYNSVGISSAIFVITLIHLILTFVSVFQFPRIFFDSVAFQGAPVRDVVLSVVNL